MKIKMLQQHTEVVAKLQCRSSSSSPVSRLFQKLIRVRYPLIGEGRSVVVLWWFMLSLGEQVQLCFSYWNLSNEIASTIDRSIDETLGALVLEIYVIFTLLVARQCPLDVDVLKSAMLGGRQEGFLGLNVVRDRVKDNLETSYGTSNRDRPLCAEKRTGVEREGKQRTRS